MIVCDAPEVAITYFEWRQTGISETEALSLFLHEKTMAARHPCRAADGAKVLSLHRGILAKHEYQFIEYATKDGHTGWLVVQEVVPDADHTNRERSI